MTEQNKSGLFQLYLRILVTTNGSTGCSILACIKAWVNEHAYNGEYMDILIMMTRN